MATTDTRPRVGRPEPPTPRGMLGYGGRERPAAGWELWMWFFMRVSGVLLLFLAVGHVLVMHVVSGGVARVNFGFVATRWQSPFWRIWDWLLLSLALLHGINGLRIIVMDYVRPVAWRVLLNMVFYVIGFVLFAVGTEIVFTFDPSKWPGTR
jgi:succinate dehydrogenase / fumarate reductase, membrane anchor subunit